MKKALLAALVLITVIFTACMGEKKTATFQLGVDPSFIPLNTMGQEAHILGFLQDSYQKIGQNLNDSIMLIRFSWDDLLPHLKTGKLDAVITTLSPYNFYKKDFMFSDPLIKTGPCLVSSKTMPYKELEDLNTKILGIIMGANSETIAAGETSAIIQSFESPSSLLDALVRGQIDAALLDYLIAYAYCQDLYQDHLIITSEPFGEMGLRLMIKKDDPKSHQLIDGTNRFIESKDISSYLKKWQLPSD